MAQGMPWWTDLHVPVLRHVRAMLNARRVDLVLAERTATPEGAIVTVRIEIDAVEVGKLCAVPWASDVPMPARDRGELELIEAMLTEAAREIARSLHGRPRSDTGSPIPRAISESEREDSGRSTRAEYDELTGNSKLMQELYGLIDRLATADTTVLVQGENGTGKELVARAIHHRSRRVDRRFVVTNCSAFNDNLLDSELFGHKRGAFTGAVVDKPGLFEVADGGTFFLDEIGDMSPALQVKVLRVLQEGTFNRVGDTETRKVDVRIIAATNRDLAAMVKAGAFREDLFYRVNVINVVVPALRERREDIPLLVERFLRKHYRSGVGSDQGPPRVKIMAPECMAMLTAYAWPGNVRELENEVERLIVLAADAPVISANLISPRIRERTATNIPEPLDPKSLPDAVEYLERKMIAASLAEHRGNKTRAAAELKVSRRNLIRLVHKYDLDSTD